MIKTYKYKLKPTKDQTRQFERILGTCRFVYNLAKDCKEQAYKKGVGLSKYDLMRQLPDLKEYDWIKQVPSQTLQAVIDRMDRSFQNFFHGAGYPKWATKDKYKSFLFKQGVKVDKSDIQLPKIGKVKYHNSRNVGGVLPLGNIKTATISKEVSGWYISVTFEAEQYHLPKVDNRIGIDVGISHLVVTSDGELIENPKYTRKYERELRVAQRSLARKPKGSNNRKKQKLVVAKLHEKIRNCRKDYQHKVSSRLVSENQAIALETLVVSNMLKNRKLSKSISDASWYQFVSMLEYKCKWYGREFVKVPAAYTSRDCSTCGYRTEKMPLQIRQWVCPECSTENQRDVNAAQNILARAVPMLANVEGLPSCVGQESPGL